MNKREADVAASLIRYDMAWLAANPEENGEFRPRRPGDFGDFEREADEIDVRIVYVIEFEGELFRGGMGEGLMLTTARLDETGEPVIRLLAHVERQVADHEAGEAATFRLSRLTGREAAALGRTELAGSMKLEHWKVERLPGPNEDVDGDRADRSDDQ